MLGSDEIGSTFVVYDAGIGSMSIGETLVVEASEPLPVPPRLHVEGSFQTNAPWAASGRYRIDIARI